MMKAWWVYMVGNEDEGGLFVHAENRTDAKRKVDFAQDVDNWVLDLGARRAKPLDGKPLTEKNILEAGYLVVCASCECTVSDGDRPVIVDDMVFCRECAERLRLTGAAE